MTKIFRANTIIRINMIKSILEKRQMIPIYERYKWLPRKKIIPGKLFEPIIELQNKQTKINSFPL